MLSCEHQLLVITGNSWTLESSWLEFNCQYDTYHGHIFKLTDSHFFMTRYLEKSVHLVVRHGILEAHFLYCSSSVVYKSFPLPVHNLSFSSQLEIFPQSNSLGMGLRQRMMWWEQRKLMKYELRVRWENNDHEDGLSASQRTEVLGDLGPILCKPQEAIALKWPEADDFLCVLLTFLATACHLDEGLFIPLLFGSLKISYCFKH